MGKMPKVRLVLRVVLVIGAVIGVAVTKSIRSPQASVAQAAEPKPSKCGKVLDERLYGDNDNGMFTQLEVEVEDSLYGGYNATRIDSLSLQGLVVIDDYTRGLEMGRYYRFSYSNDRVSKIIPVTSCGSSR